MGTLSMEARFQERDLERAVEWCGDHPDFDDTFIISLSEFFKKRGYLTDKQYSALQNVMDKWEMYDDES